MENKNCNGYESMYTFLSDEDFQKHLAECEECAAEHERMQRVSALIQEAKPYIKNQQRRRSIALKAACASFVLFCSMACFQLFMTTGLYDEVVYNNSPTIEEMGLPVDEYGFLMIN